MSDLMSPTDPIFFLHHANIDRLWDVWTRKQQNRGLPILPDGYLVQPPVQGTDYFRWSSERFLFFTDGQGQAATKTQAGDYVNMSEFNYEYQPGSGEEVVAPPVPVASAAATPTQRFIAQIARSSVTGTTGANGLVTLPTALLHEVGPAAPALFAKVTIDVQTSEHAQKFRIFVGGPADLAGAGPSSPFFAGTVATFGHHMTAVPFTFTVPLSPPLTALRSSNQLSASAPLNVRVVPVAAATPHAGMLAATASATSPSPELISIEVETH
jgi:tyrosinase